MSSVIIHYQELALRGRNRPWFIGARARDRTALADLDVLGVRALMGRIEVRLGPDVEWAEVRDRLAGLAGDREFRAGHAMPPDLEAISSAIVAISRAARLPFRVAARRADKRFPVPSPDIERLIGRRVQGGHRVAGRSVPRSSSSTSRSSRTTRFSISIWSGALVAFRRERVARSRACSPGGIDSPVALAHDQRRGCRVYFIHFHSYLRALRASQDKARQLVEVLTRHQLRSRLFLVPFAPVQQQVLLTVPAALRVVIYRRLMVRIADRIAFSMGAHALVTGDVVGQVASQTIENLAVVEGAATLPLLRPLLGFDKEEITREAQRLGIRNLNPSR
jgi:thiamine biosynthesis protein ThiI